MTKFNYLKNLKENLEHYQIKNIQEILVDYEEHFNHGFNKGKSESEIIMGLGSPEVIAKAFQTESMVKEIENPNAKFRWGLAAKVIVRLLVLAPLNFFILLIPGSIVTAFVFTGWVLAGVAALVSCIIAWYSQEILSISTSIWAFLSGFFLATGFLGMSVVGVVIMFVLTKYILLALIDYLKWNLEYIKEK